MILWKVKLKLIMPQSKYTVSTYCIYCKHRDINVSEPFIALLNKTENSSDFDGKLQKQQGISLS